MPKQSIQHIAHVKQDSTGEWHTHSLEEHLLEVARISSEMATQFGGVEWAYMAGLWHDLGKYRPAFQNYICKVSGFDPEAHIEQGRVDHSTAGAIYAVDNLKGIGQLLAYLIAGHHAGLPDWGTAEAGGSSLSNRLEEGRNKGYLKEALGASVTDSILHPQAIRTKPLGGKGGLHLWLRMLFSCLVDADFLDTESFMDPEKAETRCIEYSIASLKKKFDAYMAEKTRDAQKTTVNDWRANILQDCRNAAQEAPGIFTLTVPTGGGKTLSSMAFALNHAVKHNKRRVIFAIPYTSIIEQTAQQYREIFGDAVLEHHSNLDPDKSEKENSRARLATENWDAPIIVTTNVQLFESLFAARTSRCRKLHNLVNSVIVLDEAQLLPPDFLQPTLDVLRLLTENYGVTLVLSTATQPALGSVKDSFGRNVLRGLDARREIISDVDRLFTALKRVNVALPSDWQQRSEWPELAKNLANHERVLVIVNSRRDARELHALMPEGTIHLSALMCGEHRSRVIADIKDKLKNTGPVRVVSTQLVEAGVDLDFPVVYRALAGLDSIAQAAGRCNREGKLATGLVKVFIPPKSPARGLLLYGEQATRSILHGQEKDPLSHELFEQYFRHYFAQEDADKHGILPLLTQDAGEGVVQFRSAASKFQLIADTGKAVLVPYKQGEVLIEQLRHQGPERHLLRKLQRYTVNVPENEFNKLREIGAIVEIQPGLWAVDGTHGYDPDFGLLMADALYSNKPEDSVF